MPHEPRNKIRRHPNKDTNTLAANPQHQSDKHTAAWFLLPLLYFPLRIFAGTYAGDFLLDDAYITLRYVQNVLQAGALQYNVGESIFGITTILYPFLLIPLAKLLAFLDLTTLVVILNTTLEVACFVVLYQLLRRNHFARPLANLIAVLTLASGTLLISSQGGMETPLFCLLILLAILTVEKHIVIASLCASLALFTRPEGLVLMVVIFGLNLVRPRSKVAFVIPIIGGLTYMAFFYFGYNSIIPASVEAKRSFPQHEALRAATYMINSFRVFLPIEKLPILVRILPILALVFYGALRWPKKNFSFAVLTLFPAALLLLYTVANPHMWFWYSVPMTLCAGLFFFHGLFDLTRRATSRLLPLNTLLCILFIAVTLRWAFLTDGSILYRYTDRVAEYAKLVETLKTDHNLTKDSAILTHEIGAIGYYAEATIYDAVGLTNPELAPLGIVQNQGKMSHGRCTAENIAKCSPDFLIFQDTLYADGLRESEKFKAEYNFLLEAENTHIPGLTGNLLVYARKKSGSNSE